MSGAPDPALDGAYGPVRRKEDARFLRGQGTFVDDIQRPGMLHGAILRSPLAHARIASVDTAAAEAHPRVRAVITGEMLEQRKLAWMPTLSRDVQAVLATDKVRFQGQEVAFVVAEDRYSARDALELIQVEYEPLPAVVDAKRALDPGAPLIRDDVAGRRTTTSSTGRPATGPPPTRPSPPRTWWSARTCCTRARIPRPWRPAARWPRWTR